MRRRIASLFLCVLALSLFQRPSGAEETEKATVKAETLTVYSKASTSADAVMILKKGDVVSLQLEIAGLEEAWCSIIPEGRAGASGFVRCEELERASSSKPVWEYVEPLPETPAAQETPAEPQPVKPVRKFAQADVNRLVEASRQGKRDVVRAMLQKGVDVDAISSSGATALAAAAYYGQTGIVKFLIEEGADANKKINSCIGPAQSLVSSGVIRSAKCSGITALMLSRTRAALLANEVEQQRRTYDYWLVKPSAVEGVIRVRESARETLRKKEKELSEHREITGILKAAGATE